MDPFSDWAQSSTTPSCVQHWADRLIELGASWESFRRDKKDVLADLSSGGIPILAARNIVDAAVMVIERSQAPMAIFWDLGELPIPGSSSVGDIVSRLKSLFASEGDLIHFRGYSSSGRDGIPQQQRTDLERSGCPLVGPTSDGGEEEVHKMIIVDAMKFGLMNPKGATFCFLTGNVDYSYLLQALKSSQWRKIIVSRGPSQSILHDNCDKKLKWETDILQMRHTTKAPPAFEEYVINGMISEESKDLLDRSQSTEEHIQDLRQVTNIPKESNASSLAEISIKAAAGFVIPDNAVSTSSVILLQDLGKGNLSEGQSSKEAKASLQIDESPKEHPMLIHQERQNDWDDECRDDKQLLNTFQPHAPTIESRTVNKDWERDTQLLQTIILAEGTGNGRVLKSLVSPKLQEMYPARFPDRDAVRNFLARAIVGGIVVESSQGTTTFLSLPTDHAQHPIAGLPLVERAPVTLTKLPNKVKNLARDLPYVLIIQKKYIPQGTIFVKIQVQVFEKYLLLMFQDLYTAEHAVEALPVLRKGTLIDWAKASGTEAADGVIEQPTLGSEEKEEAVTCVVSTLATLAKLDDIFVQESLLRKLLLQQYPAKCSSKEIANHWIFAAVSFCAVRLFKRPESKQQLVCLQDRFEPATAPFPPDDLDTRKEENHIENLLWANSGCMPRAAIIESLKSSFKTMGTPFLRYRVITNGARKERFHLKKGPWGQFVALTKQDAFNASKAYPSEEIEGSPNSSVPEVLDSVNSLGQEAASDAGSSYDDLEAIMRIYSSHI
jgi:hypothetical protein